MFLFNQRSESATALRSRGDRLDDLLQELYSTVNFIKLEYEHY